MNPVVTRREAIGLLGALALPLGSSLLKATEPTTKSPALGAPDSSAGSAPDLANIYSAAAWMARENQPRFSFLDPQWTQLDEWKQKARPQFQRYLGCQPVPSALRSELIHREERSSFIIESLLLRATPAYDIPVRVLIPKGHGKKRLPGIVAMHCHSGHYTWGHEKIISSPEDTVTLKAFRERVYGRPWAEALAQRGYVVIVCDSFYFGARRLRFEDIASGSVIDEAAIPFADARSQTPGSADWIDAADRVCKSYEQLTAKTLFAAGATWPGINIWDDQRTVDYLVSRPEVDPARIGCAGLSGGGIRATHLIASDPRLKASCVTGWMTEFGRQLRNHLKNHSWMAYIPGLYASLDLPDAAALHAPGALLVQQCRQDTLYPMTGMQGAVEKLTAIYAKAGLPEKFRGTFYDKPHCFRPEMQDEAFAWFDHWL